MKFEVLKAGTSESTSATGGERRFAVFSKPGQGAGGSGSSEGVNDDLDSPETEESEVFSTGRFRHETTIDEEGEDGKQVMESSLLRRNDSSANNMTVR